MSSLKLKISASEERHSIIVHDCTGKHSGDNKGGWGNQTLPLDSAESAQLEIYPPDQEIPVIVDVFPDLPSIDEFGYSIPDGTFGMDTITSGAWKIGYRVKGTNPDDGRPYEKYTESIFIFTKGAECCVDKLLARTANVPITVYMKDEKKKKAVELSNLLDDALYAKGCGNISDAKRILRYINQQCICCS